jgi:hypothetical protein
MEHAFEVRLRLLIDQAEIRAGETARETAERLLREIMTVDDQVLEIHEGLGRDGARQASLWADER